MCSQLHARFPSVSFGGISLDSMEEANRKKWRSRGRGNNENENEDEMFFIVLSCFL